MAVTSFDCLSHGACLLWQRPPPYFGAMVLAYFGAMVPSFRQKVLCCFQLCFPISIGLLVFASYASLDLLLASPSLVFYGF